MQKEKQKSMYCKFMKFIVTTSFNLFLWIRIQFRKSSQEEQREEKDLHWDWLVGEKAMRNLQIDVNHVQIESEGGRWALQSVRWSQILNMKGKTAQGPEPSRDQSCEVRKATTKPQGMREGRET